MYVQMDDVDVEFLLDSASLKKIYRNPNWVEEANQRIDNIRKQNVEIR